VNIERREERQVELEADMTAREAAVNKKMAGVKSREKAAIVEQNRLGDEAAAIKRTRAKIQKLCDGA
jgi:hypothetical protein